MLIFKLYLSDLTKWRVQITGLHVPKGKTWCPPGLQDKGRGYTKESMYEESPYTNPSVLARSPVCINSTSENSSPHRENKTVQISNSNVNKRTKDNSVDATQKMAHLLTSDPPYNLNNDLSADSNRSLVISPSLLPDPISDAEANRKIMEWISESPGNDVRIPRLPTFDT
jgi:hypothetical protein